MRNFSLSGLNGGSQRASAGAAGTAGRRRSLRQLQAAVWVDGDRLSVVRDCFTRIRPAALVAAASPPIRHRRVAESPQSADHADHYTARAVHDNGAMIAWAGAEHGSG
jgi:hypothetical protein